MSSRSKAATIAVSLLPLSLLPVSLVSWLASPALGGCAPSPAPSLCEDIADCSQYASATWIQSCQTASALLQGEISDGGCGSQLSSYYACASANFACNVTTASFPGCDSQRAALDLCLERTTSVTYCARLAAAKAACPGAPEHDAGAGGDAGAPSSCDFSSDCQAECYVANVTNECNPAVAQVQAAGLCILGCPQ